jgi:hypothetical protein
MTTITNKQKAQAEAIALAVDRLRERNLTGPLTIRVFGQNLLILPPEFDAIIEGSNGAARPADHILALHYLLCDVPVAPTDEMISFRDLPGGQFYLEPYRSRTTKPLVEHFGNDLVALRSALDRFDWALVDLGDFGARVQAVEKIHLTLVYHQGDEDFGPEAEILFDSSVKRVFCTEDATVLATRLCRGLIGKRCSSCSGCGMCDTRQFFNSSQ